MTICIQSVKVTQLGHGRVDITKIQIMLTYDISIQSVTVTQLSHDDIFTGCMYNLKK